MVNSSPRVELFHYAWYGDPPTDGNWIHRSGAGVLVYSWWGLSTDSRTSLAALARSLGKIFIPNVAPGYDETRAGGRAFLTVDRENGARYDRLWAAALGAGVDYIAVTSFNEWHEGTQIEPAVPRAWYKDYGSLGPNYYIERTFRWARQFLSPSPPPSPPTPRPPPPNGPVIFHCRFQII